MITVFVDAWYTLEHLILIPLFVVCRVLTLRERGLVRAAGLVIGATCAAIAMRDFI